MLGNGPLWSVGRSIAHELDSVLGAVMAPPGSPPRAWHQASWLQSLPADWVAQWPELLGEMRREWPAVLATAAQLAGVELEPDYSRATLAIRELTLEGALETAARDLSPYGFAPDPDLPPAERLVDLMARSAPAMTAALGLQASSPAAAAREVAYETARVVRILRDGDLHSRFWHWLDRGYYEWYRPWREEMAEAMAVQEERAIAALGARAGDEPPDLSWLPPQNALRGHTELQAAVQAGRVRVFFWVQPFGLFDSWGFSPGLAVVTFGEPSHMLDEFRTRSTDIAERLKALSDPTRLMIMRMIRNYAKDNTQMADYLGIARPTVSIHAKLLREAGLIETHQEGRAVRHTVNAAEVRRLFRELARYLDLPDDQ
jgi:DNA-binding transcriptional ArsR family regulator